MRSEDFEAVLDLAIATVEKGCPTQQLSRKPCSSCAGAVGRLRNLEISDLPAPEPPMFTSVVPVGKCPHGYDYLPLGDGKLITCPACSMEAAAKNMGVDLENSPTEDEWAAHLAVCDQLHHNDLCFMGRRP